MNKLVTAGLAAFLFSLHPSSVSAQDRGGPDFSAVVARWEVRCDLAADAPDAAAIKRLFLSAIAQGYAGLRRTNPVLADRFEWAVKGETIELGCGKGSEWNFRAYRHIGGYAIDINDDLLSILIWEVKSCGDNFLQTPRCVFSGVRSSMFHELLHVAGFNSVPVELHNHVSNDPGRRDVVVSCALASFGPSEDHCRVCSLARLAKGALGTRVSDSRSDRTLADRVCGGWVPPRISYN